MASAQRALGFSRVGSSMSKLPDPSIGPGDFESHGKRAVRRGKERIRIVEAYLAEEMAEADAADVGAQEVAEEEAIHARILKKRQRRNTSALARKQNRAVRVDCHGRRRRS
ncbi:hypothetical protein D1007_21667 [Hordeum vulgare]|nr:hypothetical protein D1007_21667 [Hordeum vulgare]